MYTSLFQYFDCRGYEDEQQYLVVEPSIKCTDTKYRAILPTIVLLCIIVTVGFPLAYFLLLRYHSKGIDPIVLGRFKLLGENMAKANIALGARGRKRSLFQRKTRQSQFQRIAQTVRKATEKSGPVDKKSKDQKTSDYWANELSILLKIEVDRDVLRSPNIQQCTTLIKRAYNVKLWLLGPVFANYWLQEGSRACNTTIESSRFLWVS
jgi:hypothetical protein